MKHTPESWTMTGQMGSGPHACLADVRGPNGRQLATIEYTDDPAEADANARMMAAASNLLDSLKELLEWAKVWGVYESPEWVQSRDKARAAIAKATGGTDDRT